MRKISFSSLYAFIFGKKYIPDHILKKCGDDIFYESDAYLDYYKNLQATPEIHYENDCFHGYIDWTCNDKFIEVKRRSKINISIDLILQCEIYKLLTGKSYELHIWLRGNKAMNTPNVIIKESEVIPEFKNRCKKIIEFAMEHQAELVEAIYGGVE